MAVPRLASSGNSGSGGRVPVICTLTGISSRQCVCSCRSRGSAERTHVAPAAGKMATLQPFYRMPSSLEHSAHRGSFLFVGGMRVLDFLNTRLRSPAEAKEFLGSNSDLGAWAEAAELPYAAKLRDELRGTRGRTTLERIKAFREIIRVGIERWKHGQLDSVLLDALNSALSREPRYLQLRRTPNDIKTVLASRARATDRLFADVARSAAHLLLRREPQRLKQCEGPGCSLMFYDESKPGTRRWCSMELCGRDAKVRALGARRRKRSDRIS